MKIGFFTPYLDILGGGEKYLLDIAKASHNLGYKPVLFWKNKSIISSILTQFGSDYSCVEIDTTWHSANSVVRLIKTKQFEAFFYHPDGSYFMSWAKKNYALLQVPEGILIPKKKPVNSYKFNFWTPVYNSRFTKQFFERNYKEVQKGVVLYPTISTPSKKTVTKEKIILSVGRFYEHLHSKKQDVLIQAFIDAQKQNALFKDYKLILAGAYKEPDGKNYLQKLKKLIGNNSSIELRPNINTDELTELYNRAQFYWHATGYDSNVEKEPEKAEHFGISIVEAMSFGTIPIAFAAGGPIETIISGKTGFLFNTIPELISYTGKLISDKSLYSTMQKKAVGHVQDKFGYKVFQKQVKSLLI